MSEWTVPGWQSVEEGTQFLSLKCCISALNSPKFVANLKKNMESISRKTRDMVFCENWIGLAKYF